MIDPSVFELAQGIRKLTRGSAWLRRPTALATQKVCLLATYSGDGRIARHTLHLAGHWKANGFKVLLIVATRRRTWAVRKTVGLCELDGLLLRQNRGYDFGSWAEALQSRPDIRDAALVALTNDSIYGPLHGFAELLQRVDATDADVIGMTDSHEVGHHIQSYLVFYRRAALHSDVFNEYFQVQHPANTREEVILQREVPLLSALQGAGLRVKTLFPTPSTTPLNPTLLRWRELLECGFPFIKVQVLRDSFRERPIEGWQQILSDRGFDPAMVQEHLGI
jgi:lipopolysaccharide biosynthesis protein